MRKWKTTLLLLLLLAACTPTTTLPPPTTPPVNPTSTTIPPPTTVPTVRETTTPIPARSLALTRLWRTGGQDIIWDIGITDLEADGHMEVWAASYDQNFYLFDETGRTRWFFASGAPIFAAMAADLDQDGRPEFILGGDSNALHALGGEGNLLWSFAIEGRVTHVATGDTDGDGRPEVIAASWDGRLYILDAEGDLRQTQDLEERPTALRTADIDGDGLADILAGTESGQVLALTASGEELWRHGLEGSVRSLLLTDLGSEGTQIAAASQEGMVALFDLDGTPRWARRLEGTIITLGALPQGELVLVGQRGGIVALAVADGAVVWEQPGDSGVWTFAVQGSGPEPVLAAGLDNGHIVLLDRWGQWRGDVQLPSRVHGLLVHDLDGNGRLELLARSGDYVYAFHTSVAGDADQAPPYVATMPRWPDPSPLPPIPEGHISMVVVGDVMVGRSVEPRMRAYGTSYPFERMATLLQQADITVGNLECVLAKGGEADTYYSVRAHPDMAAGLSWAGFDLLNLANDHALDYGQAGLEETLATLEAQGIQTVGAGSRAGDAVVIEVRGIQVAFLARNAIGNPQQGVAWVEDEEDLQRDIVRARRQADVVVLLLHAGLDYASEPTEQQRLLARAAVEAGADMVVGYHSHILQGAERHETGLIAYSLGDFVFDIDILDAARDGTALQVVLTKDGLTRVDRISTRIVDDVQPRPVAAPGGRVETYPLLVDISEPLPPPPPHRPHYVLAATVDPNAGWVQVEQKIGFPNTTGESLEEITLFVFPNAFPDTFFLQHVAIEQRAQSSVPSYALAETTLRIFLPQALPPGETLTITTAFSLSLPTLGQLDWPPLGNLGRNQDGRAVHLGHWYPQLVPYRRGYGWQTWSFHPVGDPFYADLADYRVKIKAPEEYIVAGSGPGQLQGGYWNLSLEAVRDFAVFMGRDYAELSAEVEGIQVRSVFRQEHTEAGQAVLEIVQQGLSLYQELYGPYPYDSFTVFEGDMNGGMEYSGLVLVGTPFYAGYQGHPRGILPGLTVHELAHQWWYGVVGNDQVHEPWLDEFMARYSEVLFYEAFYPDDVDWWWETRIDRWNPSGPLDVSIYDYADTSTYVHNLYGQAAHFAQDLRLRLGDEAFFSFLQRYYREYAWQRASRRDFFRLLEEETGVDLDDLIQAYFRE